jgi:hypothetical protein
MYVFSSQTEQQAVRSKETQPKQGGRQATGPNLNASRGRGGRNKSNLIQSHSIFEDGPTQSTRRCKSTFS